MTICDVGLFLLYIRRPGLFADLQIKLPDSFIADCVSNHFLLHHLNHRRLTQCVLLLIEFNTHITVQSTSFPREETIVY